MARVYAAVANGGTLVTPHIGKAVMTPEGELVRRLEPKPAGRVPVEQGHAGLAARRAAVGDRGRHRRRPVLPRGVPARQAAGRVEDRHGRGLRQADHVVVRLLRARGEAAVRRGDDGLPGRHRLRASPDPRSPSSTRPSSASAGRASTSPGRCRREGTPRPSCRACAPTAPWCSPRAADRPRASPTCRAAPSLHAARTGTSAAGGVGDERRLPPHALLRAAATAGVPADAPRLRAAPDGLDAAARGAGPVRDRRGAGVVGDPAGGARHRR